MNSLPIEYGSCPCTGVYEKRTVEITMTVDGETVVLENVPQGACPFCGSRVYKTEVLERIEALFHQRAPSSQDNR